MSIMDISAKLGKEKPKLKISEDKSYEVDTGADTYIIVQDKLSKKEININSIYEMISILLGEKALKEIKEMNPTLHDLQTIMIAISALVNEIDYEEMEKRIINPS